MVSADSYKHLNSAVFDLSRIELRELFGEYFSVSHIVAKELFRSSEISPIHTKSETLTMRIVSHPPGWGASPSRFLRTGCTVHWD